MGLTAEFGESQQNQILQEDAPKVSFRRGLGSLAFPGFHEKARWCRLNVFLKFLFFQFIVLLSIGTEQGEPQRALLRGSRKAKKIKSYKKVHQKFKRFGIPGFHEKSRWCHLNFYFFLSTFCYAHHFLSGWKVPDFMKGKWPTYISVWNCTLLNILTFIML